MGLHALQTGRIYVRQHLGDAHLTFSDLRDMVGREKEAFSNRVLHFDASLICTRQYWFRQQSCLTSMVDTLGLPQSILHTVQLTYSGQN
jgi:hypothetical protein